MFATNKNLELEFLKTTKINLTFCKKSSIFALQKIITFLNNKQTPESVFSET